MARSSPGATQTPAPSITYQPGLDGLRGVAVLAVLLYHGGVTWMRGGFLGVDLFFVLSGFLITTLLLVEWGRSKHIDLPAFWLRRARRLLPALGLLLLGVVAFAALFADRAQLDSIRDDGLSSLVYVTNWRFVLSGQSYFDQFGLPSPLRHMWSLAIEEQFYFVWPFIVLGLVRFRPRLRLLARVFAVAAVASALLMAVLYRSGSDPSRVYYGTDTRAQALLVGATLAALVLSVRQQQRRRTRASSSAAWARAGLFGSFVLLVVLVGVPDTDVWMYHGGYLLVAVACAAVIGAAIQPRHNVVRQVLSIKPLRAIGMVSYGLYLWHWPVYLTLTDERVDLSGTPLLLARLAVTAVFAIASYRFVEMPVRRGTFLRDAKPVVIATAGAFAVIALAFVIVPAVRGTTEAEVAVASPSADAGDATGASTPPGRVLVVGDSVAKTLGDGFDREAHASNVELFNRGQLACGLAQRATIEHGGRSEPTEPTCDDWPQHWKAWVDEIRPDVSVVVFDVFVVQDLEVDGRALDFGTKESDRYLLSQLDRGVKALQSQDGRVVLMTAPYNHRPEAVGQPVNWDEDDPARIDHWNALLRRYVERTPGVELADLNEYVSPDGEYANTREGVTLRYDGVHFNPSAGQLVFRWLLPQIGTPTPATSTTTPTTVP
jgi:peptidoglycan/LPS O-acetylase OafA/YrhL